MEESKEPSNICKKSDCVNKTELNKSGNAFKKYCDECQKLIEAKINANDQMFPKKKCRNEKCLRETAVKRDGSGRKAFCENCQASLERKINKGKPSASNS